MGEYSRFVEEVRRHRGDKNALERAVRECIKDGVLAEYLKRKSSEVVNMLMEEYDYDMDIAVQREEAMEEGEARGRKEGLVQEKRSTVFRLLAQNLPISVIAAGVGLVEKEVEEIIRKGE